MIQLNGNKAYTANEAAEILMLTPTLIRRDAKAGNLPSTQLNGRYYIYASDLKEYAERKARKRNK